MVGIGANLPTDKPANKIDVVRRAITLNQPNLRMVLMSLAKVVGFDLVGIAGVMLGAASCGLPVLLDGFLLMRRCARSLPDVSCNQTVSHSFSLVEKKARV